MKPVLGPYQRRRMAQRGITEEEIIAVVTDPESDWPSKDDPGRRIYRGHPGGRAITVVIVEGTEPPRVITVWETPQ